ncbi:MAG: type II toxin-antitoxin system VapC family toxin [Thermoproteota archaeon]
MSYVVDASVVVAWFIPGEPWSVKARRLRDNYVDGQVKLYAPSILIYELNNSLWKAVRRSLMSVDTALACVEAFSKISPELIQLDLSRQLEALKIASEEDVSFYDSAYIVTARATSSTLVSADSDMISVARKYVSVTPVSDLS